MKKVFISFILGFCVILLFLVVYKQSSFNDEKVAVVKKEEIARPKLYESKNIKITEPKIGQKITSPVVIKGEVLGNWFFEASLPIKITDSKHVELGRGVAKAEGNWMTTEFVPFTASVKFNLPDTASGFIVIEKDNPSGNKENDASEEFPIKF